MQVYSPVNSATKHSLCKASSIDIEELIPENVHIHALLVVKHSATNGILNLIDVLIQVNDLMSAVHVAEVSVCDLIFQIIDAYIHRKLRSLVTFVGSRSSGRQILIFI
jgi:hypothetical protein